jgi:hypothetical protein
MLMKRKNKRMVLSGVPCQEVILGKIYRRETEFISICKAILEWSGGIQSRVSFLCKIVVIEEVTENCCGLGKGTVREPRGRRKSAIGSRHQKTGKYIAG